MDLGRAIKLCRAQKGLTQAELAKRANMSVSYLSLLEQNKRDPTLSTIEKLAFALNVPFSILIFLAAGKNEFSGIDDELAEKLSHTALSFLHESSKNKTLL